MGFWSAPQRDVGTEVPCGRGGTGSVALSDNQLLVFGGADRSPQGFNDFWLLELAEGHEHWTKISPKLGHGQKKPLPRSGCSLTFVDGKVYIFGGQEPVSGAILDELLLLEVGSWELHTVQVPAGEALPPARHSHVAGTFERDSLVVFGGAGLRGPLNDVWTFSTRTQQWGNLSAGLAPEACPEPREMAAGCVLSDAGLFVHGGRGAEGEILGDVAIFDGRAAKWVLIQATPYARCAHTASNAVQRQPAQQAAQQQQQQQEQQVQEQEQEQQQLTPQPPEQPAGSPHPHALEQEAQLLPTADQPPEQQEQDMEEEPQQDLQQQPMRMELQPANAEPPASVQHSPQTSAQPSPPPSVADDSQSPPVQPGSDARPGAASTPAPVASNVLLYGGFTGEAVSGELLQLTFVRQSHAPGVATLRVELRPVKAKPPAGAAAAAAGRLLASPPPRFAHSSAVLQREGGAVDIAVFGGVNQTDDLNDVIIWTL